jgi:hypothetical protein
MRLARITTLFLVLVIPFTAYAQKSRVSQHRPRTIEGTVVDKREGPSWLAIVIESGGRRYMVTTAYNPNSLGRDPVMIGDVESIGARVKVTYIGSEPWEPNMPALYATRIVRVSSESTSQRRGRGSVTGGDWQSFWIEFHAAVRKRDRIALRQLMSTSFEWAGDGNVSAGEAINNLDRGVVSWQSILKSVNNGVINCKSKDSSCWNFSGRQAKRTIKHNWLVFELEAGGRWRWVRLVGD